jgi:cholesterol transport system auxiliary component
LRVRLNDGSANRVLATREITVKQPMQQKGPQGGVAAANAALAQALEQVAGFVLENTP